MAHLVAIDLPGGDQFVNAVRRVWDAGDAAFPIDHRLPVLARRAVLRSVAPDRLIDADGIHRLDGRGVQAGDALVVATSGTTGDPRGVVLTQSAVAASAHATSARLGVTGDDTWLACLPLSHIGGLAVVARALITDTALIVHDGFEAAAVDEATTHGATLVSLVATALKRIRPESFRRIVLGGSRPPDDLPPNVVSTYGMTETGSGVVYDGVPLEGVEVRVDPSGEIHVRGPMLLRCYRDETTPVVDGWLATADLGEIDGDGRLVVHGRRGDLIITGGENVWPTTVESVVARHPAVEDVAVGGVADVEWGQRVVAWIVPSDPANPPSLPAVRAWVGDALPAYMAPKELRIVARLPTTASGKVRRTELHHSID